MNIRKSYMRIIGIIILIIFTIISISVINIIKNHNLNNSNYDVVIYGGTSAGIMAAYQIKEMGKSIIVIEPTNGIGGMTTSGLGATDTGKTSEIGGLALKFYKDMGREYGKSYAVWNFEPKVALKVFKSFVNKYKIPIVYNERLKLKSGVVKSGTEIVSITMESGKVYRGKVFIDATYEGDLMSEAGVSFTTGREPNAKYKENSDGIENSKATNHQLPDGIDPYVIKGNPNSGLIPNINSNPIGLDGSGDSKLQSYTYRLCLTNVPKNRIKIEKPKDYNELEYELLFRTIEKGQTKFAAFNSLPNGKVDLNNSGGISTDYIGGNYNYIDSDYETREKISKAHKTYEEGLLWTLQNNPRVPENIRKYYSQWGLPKDEFTESSHWPTQLYVREGRRMVSDFVMTEQHIERQKTLEHSIGMGSYTMDSHNVQRYISNGYVKNEGNIELKIRNPYPISYDAIVPKIKECNNLLVPVCLSASHIAYGSIRMEPVFMILGQSAGTAAAYAIEDNVSVQKVNYNKLHDRLISDGQVLQ